MKYKPNKQLKKAWKKYKDYRMKKSTLKKMLDPLLVEDGYSKKYIKKHLKKKYIHILVGGIILLSFKNGTLIFISTNNNKLEVLDSNGIAIRV